MKTAALLLSFLVLLSSTSLSAQSPAELRAKAIALLQAGKDNEALATMQQLLNVETPSDRGLASADEPAGKSSGTVKLFDSLSDKGFRLQREPGPSGDAKPAEFSFTRTYLDGGDTSWSADFFLGWQPKDQPHNRLLELSVQGKLRTGDEATDAWIFRAGGEVMTKFPGVDSMHIVYALKEEANMDFDFNRIAGEISITATKKRAALGQYRPIAERDPVTGQISDDPADLPAWQFRWRPYIGGDFGTWIDDVPTEEEDTSARGFARVTADLRMNWLRAALDLDDASLFADETVWLTDGAGDHSYLKAGLNLMFNENIGFSLTYTIGEDAPLFVEEKSLTGALTVKF